MTGRSVVKSASNSRVGQAVRVLASSGCSRIRSTTLTTRTFSSGRCWRSRSAAASVSRVGTSPAQASTTSGLAARRCWPTPRCPAPRVQCSDRLVHGQPVRRGLLAGHDHVDVVAAAQAVVGRRQQGVGVRRQVDPDHLGLLVHHVVDEARVLVGEAVVVLPPDVRGQQVVQRGDRPPPGDAAGSTFSHLACWLNIESTMWMNAS